MNYVSWIDSDGQAHDISEMPTEYIKNCIKCIQNSDYENKTKKDAQKKLDEKSEQLSNKLNEKASSFFK